MNELKVFQNSEFGELGVLIIDGKEFFPASQCAKILGYTNPRDAIKRHCKSEGVVKHDAHEIENHIRYMHFICKNNRVSRFQFRLYLSAEK